MNKMKLRYVATCHGKRARTKENIAIHKEFAENLINFDVDFFEVNTQDLGNWGGMIGLVSLHLESHPDLPEDGYLACFEDDFMLKDEEALIRAINTIESESKDKNLAYVGHGTNFYNGNNWKACQDWKDRMGEWAKWTDGGLYVFKNSKLIEIKNKLKVLPGKTTPDGTDVPLDRNSNLDFKETITRIWEHEVGFPTRLSLHGYEIFAIENENFIRRLNESYENNED
jgi:hypothetical protein